MASPGEIAEVRANHLLMMAGVWERVDHEAFRWSATPGPQQRIYQRRGEWVTDFDTGPRQELSAKWWPDGCEVALIVTGILPSPNRPDYLEGVARLVLRIEETLRVAAGSADARLHSP